VRFAEFTAAVEAAEDHWQSGRWGEALDAYRELVHRRLAEKGETEALTHADLIVLQRLADLAVPFGETEVIDELLSNLVVLYHRRGLPWCADLAAIKRLHLALGADKLYAAREVLKSLVPSLGSIEAIDLSPAGLTRWEAGRPWPLAEQAVLFTQLYLGLGRLLAGLGQYRDALITLERGLFHARADAPPLAREANVPLRLAIAAALFEKGDLATASETLGALAALDERVHPGSVVRRCELLAKVHLLRGELGAAVEQFEWSVEICRERGFHRASLVAVANLAHIRILLNQTGEAERLVAAVADGAQAFSDVVLGKRAALLFCLARVRGGSLLGDDPAVAGVAEMQQGALPAEMHVSEAPVLLPESPAVRSASCLAAFEDRALELQIELARQDLDRAVDVLAIIKQGFGSTDSNLIQLRLRVLCALVVYYQGQATLQAEQRSHLLERAEGLLQQARSALRQMGLKPDLYQLQRMLGWCQRHLERPAAERDALATENQQLLEEIARSLAAEEKAAYLINKWRTDEEALAIEIDQIVRLRDRANRVGRCRRLAFKWQILQRLSILLDRIYRNRGALAWKAIAGKDGDRYPGLPSLRRQLLLHPMRRATLAFLVLPDRVLVTRWSWMSFDFNVLRVPRLQVRELVRSWHEAALGVSPSAIMRVAQKIDEQLRVNEILQALPSRVRSLTVVPDDSLHGFPFAALPWQSGYLVDRFAISISYQSAPRRIRRPSETRHRALVAGIDLPVGSLPGLPGTSRQLRRVIEWLKRRGISSTPLRNGAVSRSLLLEQLPRVSLCHLSCHGIFQPDDPDATGLVLLPLDDKEQLLSFRDLSSLRLEGVRHVTLVSCWAADNFILPGRWIVSLPEILWRRGAASIMGCLWEVEDRAALRFLRRFYWALDKFPRDQALRYAQRCALKDPRTSDPLLWAGYQLYGDPGRLEL